MLKSIVALLALLIIVTGCSSANLLSQLTGNEWNVTSIQGKVLKTGDELEKLPTLNFSEDGKLFGSTGCNNFNGSFKLTGSSLSLDPGAITKMMCPGNTEMDLLNAFRQVTSLKMDGSTLNLLNGSNSIMSLLPKSK